MLMLLLILMQDIWRPVATLSLKIHHYCLLLQWPERPDSSKTQCAVSTSMLGNRTPASQHVMHWKWWQTMLQTDTLRDVLTQAVGRRGKAEEAAC